MNEEILAAQRFMLTVSLTILIVTIAVGGMFRTEVAYPRSALPAVEVTKAASFEEDLTARHWVLGLVKGRQADLDGRLAKYVRHGEAVTGLTIVTRHTWVDNLIAGATFGIYCPATVTVKGMVGKPVRAEAGVALHTGPQRDV